MTQKGNTKLRGITILGKTMLNKTLIDIFNFFIILINMMDVLMVLFFFRKGGERGEGEGMGGGQGRGE